MLSTIHPLFYQAESKQADCSPSLPFALLLEARRQPACCLFDYEKPLENIRDLEGFFNMLSSFCVCSVTL